MIFGISAESYVMSENLRDWGLFHFFWRWSLNWAIDCNKCTVKWLCVSKQWQRDAGFPAAQLNGNSIRTSKTLRTWPDCNDNQKLSRRRCHRRADSYVAGTRQCTWVYVVVASCGSVALLVRWSCQSFEDMSTGAIVLRRTENTASFLYQMRATGEWHIILSIVYAVIHWAFAHLSVSFNYVSLSSPARCSSTA